MTKISPWSPCQIGETTLGHRVVMAPLTRGRASQSQHDPTTWVGNDLMKQYYAERASRGGLIIAEAGPVSLRASGLPGIPGWFTAEQINAWRPIVEAVHERGGFFFAQLWHQGRNTHSSVIGQLPESSSAIGMSGSLMWSMCAPQPFETPKPMTLEDIAATQADFVRAGRNALEAGCDGVEIHAGNGYLFDQFHHSNVNRRTDSYGDSIPKRCAFTLETVDKLCSAIGPGRLGVRLSPFGLFNETNGEDRLEQWLYLCTELSKRKIAYVHLIEPRFDEFKSASEKEAILGSMSVGQDISLAPFRLALGSTKLLSAGGYGPDNFKQVVEDASSDLVAFGRYFIANPDLVNRLQREQPLYSWDRSRFYGPFPDNEVGYTLHKSRTVSGKTDHLMGQLA